MEEAVVVSFSKEKAGCFAVRFVSDGKMVPKRVEDMFVPIHSPCKQVTGLGSGQPQAVFQLQPLRRLCNAVAPTSNTKKAHLFPRRTPIAQNTNADS